MRSFVTVKESHSPPNQVAALVLAGSLRKTSKTNFAFMGSIVVKVQGFLVASSSSGSGIVQVGFVVPTIENPRENKDSGCMMGGFSIKYGPKQAAGVGFGESRFTTT